MIVRPTARPPQRRTWALPEISHLYPSNVLAGRWASPPTSRARSVTRIRQTKHGDQRPLGDSPAPGETVSASPVGHQPRPPACAMLLQCAEPVHLEEVLALLEDHASSERRAEHGPAVNGIHTARVFGVPMARHEGARQTTPAPTTRVGGRTVDKRLVRSAHGSCPDGPRCWPRAPPASRWMPGATTSTTGRSLTRCASTSSTERRTGGRRLDQWATSDPRFSSSGRRSHCCGASLCMTGRRPTLGSSHGLELVEREATDDRPLVTKGIRMALKAVGNRNPELRAAATASAARLADLESRPARSIGRGIAARARRQAPVDDRTCYRARQTFQSSHPGRHRDVYDYSHHRRHRRRPAAASPTA